MDFVGLAHSIFTSAAAAASVVAVLAALGGAISSYWSARSSSGSSGEITPADITRIDSSSGRNAGPFEVTVLSKYYNQALGRANIAFIFSMLFASIGFGVIIFAFISHNSGDLAGTVIKVVSGTIIDAVSGLFFVQSTNAQKHMSEFFEKLRLDRLNVEAREMIAEIENSDMRDDLRAQLVLKYSGIDIGARNLGTRIARRRSTDATAAPETERVE